MGTSKPLPHAQLLFILVIITAICSSNHFTASAMQQHAFSPAPAPSPAHHHHSHHHSRHVVSPTPAHSPASPPDSAVKPPTQPPAHSPVKPPSKSPAPAPYAMPPRKLVAVQGVVYCKNCSYSGVDTLMGASPLSGATVELRCKNTKYMIKKTSTTDKNGFFFLQAPKHITTYGAHKCLVFLMKTSNNSSSGTCTHATNLNDGVSGAFLFFNKSLAPPPKPMPFTTYTVGPFAFEPSKC